ncbi:hypothetical protein JQ593_17460 [Bradyrhizobium viridifuturi]|uniref:hypothetical protein n=1 Tax=uncultured Bradyrhizobium sp. TaxID=199684 RepID=UPI001BA938DC|nr:hypothetical protein [uncultured Bradyrhizobium sp.]MBR1040597.1 hypothetical protein [Bradyrhizobium viridifuturi]MBR1074885.1 hypothetical protein [Bradyrhizobium viridifuturi]
MLQAEVAFYIGGVNLQERLSALGQPTVIPRPTALSRRHLDCQNLFDVCLAISMNKHIVGNDVEAHGKNLIITTGANQGGKSTFLRSVGVAQLMM